MCVKIKSQLFSSPILEVHPHFELWVEIPSLRDILMLTVVGRASCPESTPTRDIRHALGVASCSCSHSYTLFLAHQLD